MRAIYRFRRELLVDLLRGLGPGVEVEAADAGMSLVLWLPASTRDVLVSRALQEAGIDALPLSACVLERRLRPGLLLGYSGIRPSELRDGVKRLASVLRRVGII
jgi:DNA-binding transcriptional MocR family regulator